MVCVYHVFIHVLSWSLTLLIYGIRVVESPIVICTSRLPAQGLRMPTCLTGFKCKAHAACMPLVTGKYL